MHRHPANPIITPDMVRPSNPGFRVRGAFNPGAVAFGDEILLLLRVAEDVPAEQGRVRVPVVDFEDGRGVPRLLDVAVDDPNVELKDTRGIVYKGRDFLSTLSHLRLARSRDGVHFTVDPEPFLFPADESERFGVEDARITRLGDTYWINFTVVSNDGWATALASTTDFEAVTRHGIIFPPQNKDVSIFPEKVGGRFCALHRPNNVGFGKPSIWYADSPDLLNWGNHRCLLRPRDTVWEEMKIGGGAPCLKTPEGWLQVYHGKGREQRYNLFTLLLDLDDPTRILKQAETPCLVPEAPYETSGFFPNVVFTNGLVARDDGRVLLYYGACDEFTCVAKTSVGELLATLGR
jgi:predicted GH43/DUF377 family glycosyl hydrolase